MARFQVVFLDDDGERRGLLSGVWDADVRFERVVPVRPVQSRAGVAGRGVLTWRFDWHVMARFKCGANRPSKAGKCDHCFCAGNPQHSRGAFIFVVTKPVRAERATT